MSAPIDLYVYPDEAHDVPVEAWRDGEPEATIRYLRADLKCGECGTSEADCPHWNAIERYDKAFMAFPACMAFVPKEE